MVEYYNEITSENGYHKWLESSGCIRCYKGWVSRARINRSINQSTDELGDNFVNVPFDEENSEQSDNEDDVDSERNIFDDIIIDDE